MDRRKYASAIKNAGLSKAVWSAIALASIVSNVMLSYFVITADTSEKTIVQPFNIERPFWVKGDEVSTSYLEQVTGLFSQHLLTFQKRTARNQFDRILGYAHPSNYATMSARYNLDADRISRNDIASVWHPLGTHTVGKTVYTTGEQWGYVGTQLVSTSMRVYAFNYDYTNGILHFLGHDEIKKNQSGEYEISLPEEILLIETNGALTTQNDGVQQ